jgi:TolB protein
MRQFVSILWMSTVLFLVMTGCAMQIPKTIGIFDASADVGAVKHPGSVSYDPILEQYRIKSSGTNMWLGSDEFHLVWKKVSGDFILDAQMEWIGQGVNPHRKGGLIIRESLDPGSRYVDAAFHGAGLMCMQYRLAPDSLTLDSASPDSFLSVLRLEKTGNTVRMSAAKPGNVLQPVGEIDMPFDSTSFYVGLFVCSHDSDVVEEAVFHNVRLTFPARPDFVPYKDYIGCRLEILDVETGFRKVIYQSQTPFEAPNWSKDGKFLVVNSQGKLYRIPVQGGKLNPIPTDFATSNNNDHGFSPDGKFLAISHHAADRPPGENSVVYTVPVSGGVPRQITRNSPSYWHGWSPDGQYLIYTAKRNGEWNLFRIPAEGGEEVQLTDSPGLDDGSEYSPDGRFIWFNSNRTGSMEIWRMNSDGSGETQITDDAYQNWFPHPSPDGKRVIFLSYPPEVNAGDHPYYKKVMLRLMNPDDGSIRVVAYLYGGQGTINVPSWSLDGKKVAFVSNSDRIEGK